MDHFVMLHHQSLAGEHWDIMLETDSALTTWSIPPQCLNGLPFVCPAIRLPDHRKHYLNYEGELTGNRGTVCQIDAGTYERLSPEMFMLRGTNFCGKLTVKDEMMTFEPI